jgi:hypothetical protein
LISDSKSHELKEIIEIHAIFIDKQ